MFKSAEDLCAVIIIVGCLGLLFAGIDGEVKAILAVAAGWLFGKGAHKIVTGGK